MCSSDLIGGDFTVVNNTPRVRLARLNADGTLDLTFNPSTGAEDGAVRAVAVQPDGRVIAGGTFTRVNGVTRNHLARFNVDGSLDLTFLAAPAAGANDDVLALAIAAFYAFAAAATGPSSAGEIPTSGEAGSSTQLRVSQVPRSSQSFAVMPCTSGVVPVSTVAWPGAVSGIA